MRFHIKLRLIMMACLIFTSHSIFAQSRCEEAFFSAKVGNKEIDSRPLTNTEEMIRTKAVQAAEDFVRTLIPPTFRMAYLVGSGQSTAVSSTGVAITKPMPKEVKIYASAGSDPYARFGFDLETVMERSVTGEIAWPIILLRFGRDQRINGVRSNMPALVRGYGGPGTSVEIQDGMRESVLINQRGNDQLEIIVNGKKSKNGNAIRTVTTLSKQNGTFHSISHSAIEMSPTGEKTITELNFEIEGVR